MAVAVFEVKRRMVPLAVGALQDQEEGVGPQRPGVEGLLLGLEGQEAVAPLAQLAGEEEGLTEEALLFFLEELVETKQDDQIRFPQFVSTVFLANHCPLVIVFQERQK